MNNGNKSLGANHAEAADLKRHIESLEREVLTKTKEAEAHAQDLEAEKKKAVDKENTLCQNYRKILEEQEMAMDAQVREMKCDDGREAQGIGR